MSLLFNMLSRFVIALLPRSKCLLISWLQAPSTLILEPKKIKYVTASLFPHLFAVKWWDWISWSQCFECWVLSQLFHSPLSSSSRGSLVPLCFRLFGCLEGTDNGSCTSGPRGRTSDPHNSLGQACLWPYTGLLWGQRQPATGPRLWQQQSWRPWVWPEPSWGRSHQPHCRDTRWAAHRLENHYAKEVLALAKVLSPTTHSQTGVPQRDWESPGNLTLQVRGVSSQNIHRPGERRLLEAQMRPVLTRTRRKEQWAHGDWARLACKCLGVSSGCPSCQQPASGSETDSCRLGRHGELLSPLGGGSPHPTFIWPKAKLHRGNPALPIGRKLDSRFTEHGLTPPEQDPIVPQPVPPIRKSAQASYPPLSEGGQNLHTDVCNRKQCALLNVK